MSTLRIFVVSSTPTLMLARTLKNALREKHPEWTVTVWDEIVERGQTILETLIKECKKSDLAVTLLTPDDFNKMGQRGGEALNLNCMFEAGLFIGGLGLDPQRSVLITSIAGNQLPSDLLGIRYVGMPLASRAEEYNNQEWCNYAMKQPVSDVESHAAQLSMITRGPYLKILTKDMLFSLEQSNATKVVMNAREPAETNVDDARKVRTNMVQRGVEYIYFFRGHRSRVGTVVKLIQTLALAKIAQGNIDNEVERRQLINNNPEKVVEALTEIQGKLFIYFLPERKLPLYFCVHHRGEGQVTCYLRYADSEDDVSPYCFVRWSDDYDAFLLSDDMMDLRLSVNDPAVFFPTVYFDVYGDKPDEREVRTELKKAFRAAFPVSDTLYAKLHDLCFLRQATVEAIRQILPGGAPTA